MKRNDNSLCYVHEDERGKCSGCAACAAICTVSCIQMKENEEGFLYPQIDDERCIHCDQCKLICPIYSERKTDKNHSPSCWAMVSMDQNIQMACSSGGIFFLLAEEVIKMGGSVYGVSFSEDFHKVSHVCIDQVLELSKIQTSKYLQSDINGCFNKIQDQLKAGKEVLFSGTPCQVAGLKAYLERDYDQLICVEVICHGVPSPKLWSHYLDYVKSKHQGRKISSVNFRDKGHFCRSFKMNMVNRGRVYYMEHDEDPYMRMFLRDFCLRESCYQCAAKKIGSRADITIGDFWGIGKVAPDFDTEKGTSLVLTHTILGDELLRSIFDRVIRLEVPFEKAIEHNTSYSISAQRPKERDTFFEDLQELSWRQMQKKYGSLTISRRIRKVIKKVYRMVTRKIVRPSNSHKMRYGLRIKFD